MAKTSKRRTQREIERDLATYYGSPKGQSEIEWLHRQNAKLKSDAGRRARAWLADRGIGVG